MRAIALFLTTSTLLAAPAMADPETGSRLTKNTRPGPQLSASEANLAAQAMANCVVSKRESGAVSYLLSRDEKQAQLEAKKLMGEVSCLNIGPVMGALSDTRQVTFPLDIYRGKLAEALLRGDKSAIAALPVNALQKQYVRAWYPYTMRHSYIDEMAICVAETNPVGIQTMLATMPESKDEIAAFKALVPSLPPCLRAGANLTANRQALRAALAEGLWQRIHAPASEQSNPPEEKAK